MKVVALTNNLYKEWNQFCLQSNDAWFWHTTEYLEFILNINSELNSKSLSFFVKEGHEIIAIIPLFIETRIFENKELTEFLFGGGALPIPALKNNLSENSRNKIHTFIFEYIDNLALKYNVLKVSYKLSQFAAINYPVSNYLTKHSFIDVSENTRIIDLQKSTDELWNDLRRNHVRIINKMKEEYETVIYTRKNITYEILTEYRQMHHKAAGRVTRPLNTYDKEYVWIKDGIEILVALKEKSSGKHHGFENYLIYKNNAHGFTAANDPDYNHLSIRHLIEWDAILYLKEIGCKYYEIGAEYYSSNFHYFPSDKEINISLFKQGYGGFVVPIFKGEKYYSKQYFEYTFKERIEKFKNQNKWEINIQNENNKEEELITYSQGDLEEAINKVIINNNNAIHEYLNGKNIVLNFIIGEIRKELNTNFIEYKTVIKLFKDKINQK